MLSMRNIQSAKQAAHYFEKDDYYLGHAQRSPSAWWGAGAQRLGLQGDVDREVFGRLLAGELPDGTRLPKGTGERRCGIDLTFSAPKSVSLLALVGEDIRVIEAHEKAVSEALQLLEHKAAAARVTVGQQTATEMTGNLLVARFNHDTSRSLDPQLHTHCVTLNVTQRADGCWRALTNEAFYRNKMHAGAVYRSVLAMEMAKLGYTIERTHGDGRFEVQGFTAEQLDAFSQRRRDIQAGLETFKEALQRRGLEGAKAAEWVTQRTRRSKRDVDRKMLRSVWRDRAQELGIAWEKLPSRSSSIPCQDRQAPGPTDSPPLRAAQEAVRRAAKHFAERRALFSDEDLQKRAMNYSVGKASPYHVMQAVKALTAAQELLPAVSEKKLEEAHFTTSLAWKIERRAIDLMQEGRGAVAPLFAAEDLEALLAEQSLSAEQRAAVCLVASTPDRITGIQGYAGTGKTTMMRAMRDACQKAGTPLCGIAPSAAAALVLQNETAIPSQTLARHLGQAQQVDPQTGVSPLKAGAVWIVDEASLMGNNQARKLFNVAKRHRARVVLIGDRDQMPSVEAGRIFELLSEHGMQAVSLQEIRRQKDPTLKKAVELTVQRQAPQALQLLSAEIVEASDFVGLIADYMSRTPTLREETLIVTGGNEARKEINEGIRQALRAEQAEAGRSLDEVKATVLEPSGLTQVESRDAVFYAVGQVVRFGRDYQNLGVKKGTYWTVKGRDTVLNKVTLQSRDAPATQVVWVPHRAPKVEAYKVQQRHVGPGDLLRWTRNDYPRGRRNGELAKVVQVDAEGLWVDFKGERQRVNFKEEKHWDHGYCSTVHAAQGRTVQEVMMYIDPRQELLTGHESWYVALSRARQRACIYTPCRAQLPAAVVRILKNDSAVVGVRAHGEQPGAPGPQELGRASPSFSL